LLTLIAALAATAQLNGIEKSVMVNVGYSEGSTVQVASLELSLANVGDSVRLESAKGVAEAQVTLVEQIPDTEATVITVEIDGGGQPPELGGPARVTFQERPIWQVLSKWY
jgi:hypothetical protein